MSLNGAIDALVDDISAVSAIRENEVLKKLIEAFNAAPWTQIDAEAIIEELTEMSANVAFDTKAFPLEGTKGLIKAKRSRLELQSVRDRLTAMSRDLRQTLVKTAKVIRAGTVYIRALDVAQSRTAKQLDDLCAVALREIVDYYETTKGLVQEVREVTTLIDTKTKTLDSWFSLHKQYVFLTGARDFDDKQDFVSKRRHSR